MKRALLDCDKPQWQSSLMEYLACQKEVDLMNFDFATHGSVCEALATQYQMEIWLDRDPKVKVLHIRKRQS